MEREWEKRVWGEGRVEGEKRVWGEGRVEWEKRVWEEGSVEGEVLIVECALTRKRFKSLVSLCVNGIHSLLAHLGSRRGGGEGRARQREVSYVIETIDSPGVPFQSVNVLTSSPHFTIYSWCYLFLDVLLQSISNVA